MMDNFLLKLNQLEKTGSITKSSFSLGNLKNKTIFSQLDRGFNLHLNKGIELRVKQNSKSNCKK